MDDPVKEIALAINLCAGASSADRQVSAFHKYFTPDASFLHPMCYVPSRPDSRKRVIGIYLFYRAMIPETHFDVSYVAFDEKVPGKEGHLFVELVQTPSIRLVTYLTGFKPHVPMHINFHVVKSNANEHNKARTKWLIDAQEDAVQPLTVMLALPGVRIVGRLFYLFCEIMGLVNAYIFIMLGIWRPSEHLKSIQN